MPWGTGSLDITTSATESNDCSGVRRRLRCLGGDGGARRRRPLGWRSALLALFVHFRLDKWAFAAYSDVTVILLVLGWLVFVIAAETWLRQSAERKTLARRIARLDGPLVACAGLGDLALRLLG
ncbi:MAG: hypothetical protein ACRDIY_09685 [Chloroflexota bacterium]